MLCPSTSNRLTPIVYCSPVCSTHVSTGVTVNSGGAVTDRGVSGSNRIGDYADDDYDDIQVIRLNIYMCIYVYVNIIYILYIYIKIFQYNILVFEFIFYDLEN